MLRRLLLLILPLLCSGVTLAAEVTDSTGRAVQVPDQIRHVLPAGPPAAILLEAIAPDLMVGWPEPLSDEAKALLPADADHPRVPRLTGREDVTDKIKALHPDVILDYGDVTPRYFDLARATRQKTGIPTLPFGWVEEPPSINRLLGLAWLGGHEPATIAARFNAIIYGRVLTPPQLDAVLGGVRAMQP